MRKYFLKAQQRVLDEKMILDALRNYHKLHIKNAEDLAKKYPNDFANLFSDTEERFARLISKHEKRFIKLDKRMIRKLK